MQPRGAAPDEEDHGQSRLYFPAVAQVLPAATPRRPPRGTRNPRRCALALKLGCDERLDVVAVGILDVKNVPFREFRPGLPGRRVGCLGVDALGGERSAMLAYAGGGSVDLRLCRRRCITGGHDLRRRPVGPKPQVKQLKFAPLAQSAERLHGKEKVYGSIP